MFTADVERARHVAASVLNAYRGDGVFGARAALPNLAPLSMVLGSEEHLCFVTLTVAIAYQRDPEPLWESARQTYADAATRYLFDPRSVADAPLRKVARDMQRHGLARKKGPDAEVWHQIGASVASRFGGRVGGMIEYAGEGALNLLALVRAAGTDFPFLKGPKIGAEWIRLLHSECRVPLRRLEQVPLPVDLHTAQVTLQTRCLRPLTVRGPAGSLREAVQRVWRETLAGTGDYPLQIEVPLDRLGQEGCRASTSRPCPQHRHCPVASYCEGPPVRLVVQGSLTQDSAFWRIEN